MEIPIQQDGDRQPCVEWNQGCGGYNRAWVRRPTDPDKDWAGVGRYLNVLRVEEPYRGPADNSTDFPIPSDLDEPQLPRLPAAFAPVRPVMLLRVDEHWSSADAHAA